MLDRAAAEDYASWFRCLADPTRIQILHLLASSDRPLSVAEITNRAGVGQSTVSAHLKRLSAVAFVLADHVGTSTLFRFNPDCLSAFPSAADVVIGKRS